MPGTLGMTAVTTGTGGHGQGGGEGAGGGAVGVVGGKWGWGVVCLRVCARGFSPCGGVVVMMPCACACVCLHTCLVPPGAAIGQRGQRGLLLRAARLPRHREASSFGLPASFLLSFRTRKGDFCFFLFRAAPEAYGGSQARGHIGAAAASLQHSHSNGGSKPCLPPTLQFTATPDPCPTEQGQGLNVRPRGS